MSKAIDATVTSSVRNLKTFHTRYWVERDILGSTRIMMQHENTKPFCYAVFNYNFMHTSNASMHTAVVKMMEGFGIAEKDIVWKTCEFEFEPSVAVNRLKRKIAKLLQQRERLTAEVAHYRHVLDVSPYIEKRHQRYEDRVREQERVKGLETRVQEQAALIKLLQQTAQ